MRNLGIFHRIATLALGAALLMATGGVLHAVEHDSRLALVIGNGGYAESPLPNPLNDAADMARVLEELGFDVILRTDADRRGMAAAIREFGRELKSRRGVGLFYYAGHGMQLDNRNYLIPVDTPLQEEDEVPYESIDVGSVLAKMESAGNALNVLILDACRNNPFPRRFRSSSRGLARVDAPIGSLVVYATAPGNVAADGKGRNGTFTGHLIENLRIPGLDLTETIRRTRAAVVKETSGAQVPWESSSLLEEYVLNPATEATPVGTPDEPASLELAFWQSAQASGSEAEYRAYLEQYPDGSFASLARARIAGTEPLAMLRDEPMAPAATPSPKTPDPQPDPTPFPAPTPAPPANRGLASLTVRVTPDDALVRIMNIVERYQPGIELDPASEYDVYVTRQGYAPWRSTIRLDEHETQLEVVLDRVAPETPEVLALKAGAFSMGCSSGDRQCENFEKPAHEVTVRSIGMTRTEITVGQFRRFVDETGYVTDAERDAGGNPGCYIWSESGGISRSTTRWGWQDGTSWRNPGYAQGDTHPVTCVSWNDASAYARWLSSVSGARFRLPSEAEWEYAARAGSQTPYAFGKSSRALCDYANGADRSSSPKGSRWNDKLSCDDGAWFSAPVGSYRPNPFGLQDMHGNVWEWVEDTWTDDYRSTPADGSASENGDTTLRVLRGGAWDGAAAMLRSSTRSRGAVTNRAAMTGFRLVREQH